MEPTTSFIRLKSLLRTSEGDPLRGMQHRPTKTNQVLGAIALLGIDELVEIASAGLTLFVGGWC